MQQDVNTSKHNGLSNSSTNISHKNELQLFYDYLKTNVGTCTQVAEALNIRQKNCTRYKRTLQRTGSLAVIKLVRCPITGYNNVQQLTTNETLFPNHPKQLQLWN